MTIKAGEIRAGFYKRRFRKGAVYVPCELRYGPPQDPETGEEMDRSHRWMLLINGRMTRACLTYVDAPGGRLIWDTTTWPRIEKAEYDHMLEVFEFAEQHAAELPEANPTTQIDLASLPSLF